VNTRSANCSKEDAETGGEVAGARPACGSGSFLLGAYDYLLKWHLDYYTQNDPATFEKEVFQGTGGWKLTTAERKRILVNNLLAWTSTAAGEVTKSLCS